MAYRNIFSLLICVSFLKSSALAAASYGQFSSLNTQVPRAAGSSLVRMDNTDLIQNLEISADKTKIIIKEPGVYFIIASGQIGALNPGAAGYMDVWFVKNGAFISNSNCKMSVDESTFTAVLISQFLVKLDAGDTIATAYSASGPSLGFVFTQPDNEPAIPSLLLSIYKIN